MPVCKILDFLFKAVPLKPWQAFLVRSHMERCPACQSRLAGREEARRVLVRPEDLGGLGPLWSKVRSGIAVQDVPRRSPAKGKALRGPLFAAAAAIVLAVILGVWYFRGFTVENAPPIVPAEQQFELDYVRVDGRPADSYIVRSSEPKMTLVWAGKRIKGGLS
jgi:hypothetical protein